MSDQIEIIVILVGAVMIVGSLIYLRVRAGPGRTWHIMRRFLAELAKEYGPPGFDWFEKVTPAVLVGAVLMVGVLAVLAWYNNKENPLSQKISTILEIASGIVVLFVVGRHIIRRVLRGLDDDDAKQ